MANFNEKTISKMYMCVFRKFNMGLPENSQLHFSEWNHNSNFIACGGALGTLKVVKIGMDVRDPKPNASALIVNQSLEGHNATVLNATWNENNQKLTTSDTSGLIIVWGLFNDQWAEEMINNRNKSVVVGICWNVDGTKIAIAYADGNVIVGTLEGNRIWNKELEIQLASCEWAPDGDMLIFGTADGKVTVYDDTGSHYLDIQMQCLESEDLEQALAKKENQKEEIICMKYWSPTLKSKALMELQEKEEKEQEKEKVLTGTAVFTNFSTRPTPKDHIEPEKNPEPYQPVPADRPRFMVAYARGVMQLMRSLSDTEPVVVRLKNLKITGAKWSPNGAFIAISGHDLNTEDPRHSSVHFISAYGQVVGFFQHFETRITGICWEASGLRMAIAADGNLFIGHVRPEFKWGAIEDTIVYAYQKEEQYQYGIMFYDYKIDEKTIKTVSYFENLASFKEHCIIINRQDDAGTIQYFCQLCNNIGTSLDYNMTTVRPKFVCVNGMCAVVACEDRYFIWHFVLPRTNSVQAGIHVPGKSGEYILEEQQRGIEFGTKRLLGGKDSICAICIGDTFFLMALQNGGVYRANLSDGVITSRYAVTAPIDSMKLNCDFTRLAVVKLVEQVPFNITIYEFVGDELQQIYNCEKKDVWDYQWDANDSHMLAFKDKHKMLICDCSSVLEQSAVYGNIFSFQNLVVTSVNIEKLLITPESPTKAVIQESMIKAKQDVLSLLNAMKLDEAIDYAEKNPHAELWNMIAQYSVFKHQFDRAEHAFVKLEDYAGVQLVKRIRNIPSNELRNAEIFAFREQFEDAKDIFLHSDRKDLAIEMYEKVGDHRAVYELVKNDPDEERKKEAFKEMAEFHYENMDWEEAAKFFALCEDIKMQIDSLIRGNCFGELEVLARALPDESDYMVTMGDAFTTRGMCDQAVECYLKKKLPDRALHCCMELNQWQKAQFIADANHMENVEGLLGKYAEETTGASDEKSVATLGLYMRAGRHLDAAKIAFDIANDRREKMMPIDDLKQCYVLGALLVEEHRQSIRELKRIDKYNMVENTLDDESGLTAEQTRILENTWKGAEAFHYMMLAQKHLLTNRIEDALQTCVILSDYEEYLDPAEIYKMIGGDMKKIENKDFLLALAAANVGQFGICSRAMMRLEVLDTLDEAEREEMKDLSFELFSQYV
uniref:WD_REPEATS_REGION domain-containing protein n=2 Tax=Caenorhabditis tropicalis TaxID=1561998 RepID=A0A1I7TJT7_9PELO